MGDVYFEGFIRVGFVGVAVQREGFPLGRKGGVGDKVGEGVTTSGLVGREQMRWDGMVDHGREGYKGGCGLLEGNVGCRVVHV